MKLSERENQIAILIVGGRKNIEIAQELKLKEHTIKTYIWRMMKKLNVRNRTELAVLIMDNNRPLAFATMVIGIGILELAGLLTI